MYAAKAAAAAISPGSSPGPMMGVPAPSGAHTAERARDRGGF